MLHGGHRDGVAVVIEGDFANGRVLAHSEAEFVVSGINLDDDSYISQNAFGERRRLTDVAALTSLFVDLDTYNVTEFAGLGVQELLTTILDREPWLPGPTFVFDSGRGRYLSWVFKNPLSKDQLPEWQFVESLLVEMLAPYGADRRAKDPARVLRLPRSINSRNGKVVRCVPVNEPMSFTSIADAIRSEAARRQPPQPREERQQKPGKDSRSTGKRRYRKNPITKLFNAYTLAHARMQDLATIAKLRSPMDDYRARTMFLFAAVAAWFCPSENALRRELEGFIDLYFDDPQRYRRRSIATVLRKFREQKAGEIEQWNGQDVDPRYRLRNDTIIGLLDVSESEQKHLLTIIGQDEKNRRKREKRRAQGSKPREATVKERAALAARAKALREEGYSIRGIAKVVGRPKRTVEDLLVS